MTYCYRCHIALQHEKERCPLCHHKLTSPQEEKSPQEIFSQWRELRQADQHPSFWYHPSPISSKKNLHIILDFIMLALISAILIVVTVSIYQINKHSETTLSIYLPVVSLFYPTLIILIIRLYRLTLGAQWLILFHTVFFLFAIDLHNHKLEWAYPSGILIVLGGVGPFLLLQMLWRRLKVKGLNGIGFAILAMAISLVSLDGGISGGRLQGWSLFTFSSLLFLAMVFLYMHYIAKIRVNFDAIMKIKRENNKDHDHAR